MYVNVCSGTICHICRMLSSATLATTQGCDRFQLKSDTLAVWPPCTNSSSGGPDTITDRYTDTHTQTDVRRVRSGHVYIVNAGEVGRVRPSAASSGVCSVPMRLVSHTCRRRSRLHEPRIVELNGAQLT